MAPNLPQNALQTVALVRMHKAAVRHVHRTSSGAFRPGHGVRSRIPKQMPPHAIEADFASSIIGRIVDTLRAAYKPLLEALPDLLAENEPRTDAADDGRQPLDARAIRFVAGLPIVIENPRGSTRTWIDSDGTTGTTTMAHHYGYVAGTLGADGEDVDVYVGRVVDPREAHIVRQMRKSDGFATFDEHKVMLGFPSASAARDAYLAQYDDPRFFGGMETVTVDEFRRRLREPGLGDGVRMDAGETTRARRLVDKARDIMSRNALNTKRLDDLASRYGAATSTFQRQQLARQVRVALGINLTSVDREIPTLIDRFVHESVARIRSLGEHGLGDVERLVANAFTTGRRAEDVAKDIAARFDVSERHARFIARDQIGTLTGQVNAARQRSLGITRFTWRTVGDERVREEHDALNGEVFPYSSPPAIGLPGEDYNCRCSAEPEFSDILDAVRDEE